jgi:hypothetical protein
VRTGPFPVHAFTNHLATACSNDEFATKLFEKEWIVSCGGGSYLLHPSGNGVVKNGDYPVKVFPFLFNGESHPTIDNIKQLHETLVGEMKSADRRNVKISRPLNYSDFNERDVTLDVDGKFPTPEGYLTCNTIVSILRISFGDETNDPTCANLTLYPDNNFVQSMLLPVDGVYPDFAIIEIGFPATSTVSPTTILERLKKVHAAMILEYSRNNPDVHSVHLCLQSVTDLLSAPKKLNSVLEKQAQILYDFLYGKEGISENNLEALHKIVHVKLQSSDQEENNDFSNASVSSILEQSNSDDSSCTATHATPTKVKKAPDSELPVSCSKRAKRHN